MQQPVYNPVHSDAVINVSIRLPSGEKLEIRTIVPVNEATSALNGEAVLYNYHIAKACKDLARGTSQHLSLTKG